MPEITGIIDQIDAQGIAQTIDMASIRCPQLSMTRVPQAPPIVQPKPISIGQIALPCKPSFESSPSN